MEISDVTIYLTEGRDEYKSRPALCGHLFVAGHVYTTNKHVPFASSDRGC